MKTKTPNMDPQSIIDDIWILLNRIHDINNPQEGYEKQRLEIAIDKAKKNFSFFQDKDEEEIISFLCEAKIERKLPCEGEGIDAIFCDVESLINNNQIHKITHDLLRDLHRKGKKIYLWTNFSFEKTKREIARHALPWDIVSPADYAGAHINHIISILDENSFRVLTKITPRVFTQL